MSSCLPLGPCCFVIGSFSPPVELSCCSEFNQRAVRSKGGGGEENKRKKEGGDKKKKRTVSKLLLKILCWGEMQDLCLFIMLLFGKILGS